MLYCSETESRWVSLLNFDFSLISESIPWQQNLYKKTWFMYLNVNRHPQQGPHNEQENLMID